MYDFDDRYYPGLVNQDVEEGATKIVNSRYSIVLATAKRARQRAVEAAEERDY